MKMGPELYNHMDPTLVGNVQKILITEMAGRASVELKSAELGMDVSERPDAVGKVVERVKERESSGRSYEAAEASFELLVLDELGPPPLRLERRAYRTVRARRVDA